MDIENKERCARCGAPYLARGQCSRFADGCQGGRGEAQQQPEACAKCDSEGPFTRRSVNYLLDQINSLRAELQQAKDEIAQHDLWREEAQRQIADAAERERGLREAAAPFVRVAQKFVENTAAKPIVEDKDRISVRYPWTEFRDSIGVGDMRRLAATGASHE